jgi:hypothetical protein
MAATFEQAKDEVARLVAHFRANNDRYLSPAYKETWARQEFIDPFFIALGWDVRNERRVAPQYREVITEESLDVEGHRKAPDYVFRVGQTNKFFAEAKKPGVAIKSDPAPAYQLRRYAWSAKLPLSILTDFHELAVYDCRRRPRDTDKASIARIHYIGCEEYPDRFRDIWDLFGREAVWGGSFDRFAQADKGKRGTGEVDAEFLKEIEGWRDVLARNIALRNPRLSIDELNDSVQRTIDRIIFLRMAEDRGIEPYEQLRQLAQGDEVYRHLMRDLCRKCDDRYNSGLFDFEKDKVTPRLAIDDKVLRPLIAGLYFPQSPYEFSVLPPEILGNVYEQFLGKVIRLTAGHQAKIEEKPEVKKAGGVYYTPAYIVDYIVKNTVGKMTEGKSPKELEGFRVLDMACGSGSFLLGAYRHLLDWHLDWYVAHDPESWARKKNSPIWRHPTPHTPSPIPDTPAWRLTVAEKKRILLAHVFGVDIDRQAVEVTKLSLLLKVLEGESDETLGEQRQLTLWQDRALPDLDNNIKCGNSLIGPDYFTRGSTELVEVRLIPDRDEMRRINPFDWNAEFPDAMKAGGFDCVIGNPPYVFGEYHDGAAKQYLKTRYALVKGQYDTYWLFIERGINLTASGGRFSLIVPDALLARDEATATRGLLLANGLERIYHCGLVFSAGVSAVVFVLAKGMSNGDLICDARTGTTVVMERICKTARFATDRRQRLLIHASDEEHELIRRLEDRFTPLGEIIEVSRGEELGKKDVVAKGKVAILVGEDISRYHVKPPSRFVNGVKKSRELYDAPKIVVVKTGAACIAALDEVGHVTMQSVYNLRITDSTVAPEVLLGVLNSSLIRFFISSTFTAYKMLFPQINQTTLETLPFPKSAFSDQRPLVQKVRQMISLREHAMAGETGHDHVPIQRQIDATDREIDRLVYDLYGLTEEEIRIVEGEK